MKFILDKNKARLNLRKHGISFEEATTVLSDVLSVTGYDPDHSITEDCFITFGISNKNRLLTISHTEENNIILIISCRLATAQEKSIYENG
jgi:uncharacterized DUF497 family protein